MKKGFTLSEVLVTLGIVGVVAVLTVPGVMKNYANKMYTTELQKVYTQLADAAQAIMNDEHVDNFYETSVSTTCENTDITKCEAGPQGFLNRYIKSTKKHCGDKSESQKGTCISTNGNYKAINRGNLSPSTDYYCVQTTSGAAICALPFHQVDDGRPILSFIVDVNGLSQPNIAGRDVFSMDIRQDGSVVDYGTGGRPNSIGFPATDCGGTDHVSNMQNAARGCLNSVIESGWKMEY